jgi:hypothetical protein
MRRLLAAAVKFAVLPLSLAGMALISPACYGGPSSPVQADGSPAGNLCGPGDIVVYAATGDDHAGLDAHLSALDWGSVHDYLVQQIPRRAIAPQPFESDHPSHTISLGDVQSFTTFVLITSRLTARLARTLSSSFAR